MDKILIIDADSAFRESLKKYLCNTQCFFLEAEDGNSGLEIISSEHPDLIITDLNLPEMNGIDLLREARRINPENQVIILTESDDDINTTIGAMQSGAFDFLDKSNEINKLNAIVSGALERKRNNHKLIAVQAELHESLAKHILIGRNPAMKEIYRKIGNLSSNKVTVFIHGESGTGKELIARKIHSSGITKEEPFVAVNCSALSESLLESELFGHVKGAFTGAIRDKKGKFEQAGEGTIFLDEVSEISPAIQVKLLRVLQEKEFERVGDEVSIPMNARVITASNKDLKQLVSEGRFREDLYYRLNVFSIGLPPLRERKDDIPRLVVFFLSRINRDLNKNIVKIPYETMDILQSYSWPGNVRELENTLIQAAVLAKGEILEKEYIYFTERKLHKTRDPYSSEDEYRMSLAEMERKHIVNVLASVHWNKQLACEILKVSRATLYNKIKYYDIKTEHPEHAEQ